MNKAVDAYLEPRSYFDRYLPHENSGEVARPGFRLDLSTIRGMVWRQRYILLVVVGLALLAGLVITLLATPIYRASSTVKFNLQGGEIIEGENLDPYVSANDYYRHAMTMVRVLESRSMALRVADALDLHRNPDFAGEAALADRPSAVSEDDWQEQQLNAVAGNLQGGLEIRADDVSRLITITYYSPRPELAARIANSYSDELLNVETMESIGSNAYAVEYLDGEIAQVRARLQAAEERAISYARSNQIIAQPASGQGEDGERSSSSLPSTLTAANLSAINQRYAEARARSVAAEQRWNAVASLPPAQLTEVQQNTGVQALRSSLTALQQELANLRERYRDDYPRIGEVQAQIAQVERRIDAAGAEIKQAIRNESVIASRETAALRAELNRVSGETLDEQDRRVQYNNIDREVGVLRDQLAALLQRYNTISAAANLRPNTVSKLDSAILPTGQYSPNLFNNMAIALVLGLGLALAIAILRELLDVRIRSSDDIERVLGVPALGQTPYVTDDLSEEIDDPFSVISEAYSSVRATLDYRLGNIEHPVIQFTSSVAGEGKTTTVVTLAKKFASLQRKVLLVDLDLRRPSVAKHLGVEPGASDLIDVLYQRAPLSQAIIRTGIPDLDVLAVRKPPSNPVEIHSSGLIADLIRRERMNYDLIIFDSSPVMGLADAPLLSRFADWVVFVVEANRANSQATRKAARRLHDIGARFAGAVVTKYRALETGEYYYYNHQYYMYQPRAEGAA